MLGEISLAITRNSDAGSWVDGYFVPDELDEDPIPIRACVQPLTPREIMVLPEADRDRHWLKVYTTTELFTRRELLKEDTFVHQGRTYSIMKEAVQLYPGMTLSHRLYHAAADNPNSVDAKVVVP